MNEHTFEKYGLKKLMKGNQYARASYGSFYNEPGQKNVEYYVSDVTFVEAEDCFGDDLQELRSGNVRFEKVPC